jgi:hypothetical protein
MGYSNQNSRFHNVYPEIENNVWWNYYSHAAFRPLRKGYACEFLALGVLSLKHRISHCFSEGNIDAEVERYQWPAQMLSNLHFAQSNLSAS